MFVARITILKANGLIQDLATAIVKTTGKIKNERNTNGKIEKGGF